MDYIRFPGAAHLLWGLDCACARSSIAKQLAFSFIPKYILSLVVLMTIYLLIFIE